MHLGLVDIDFASAECEVKHAPTFGVRRSQINKMPLKEGLDCVELTVLTGFEKFHHFTRVCLATRLVWISVAG